MPDARITQILENSFSVTNDGIDIFIQDQTTPPFQFYLMTEDKTDIGTVNPIAKGDITFTATSGHGFTAVTAPYDYMMIWENGGFEQLKVINVAGDIITVNVPFGNSFSTNSVIVRGKIDLNGNGSVTPIQAYFRMFGPNATEPIDIIGGKVTMLHNSAGDRSKYGDQVPLINGQGTYFTKSVNNIVTLNLGDYQDNQDFEEFGWDISFDDKAGGGDFSTVATIDVKNIYGIALRLNPLTDDFFCAVIRANLTGLNRHRFILYGQYTLGEE
jgi:hypothetical protein